MRGYGTAMALVIAAGVARADLAETLKPILAVNDDGAGSPAAAAAWAKLKDLPPAKLPELLKAMNAASPLARNWLLAAVEAVAGKTKAAGQTLPVTELEAFVNDTRNCGPARRVAFELHCRVDPKARERWLTRFFDDPGQELRYDAVQTAFEAAKAKIQKDDTKKDGPKAKADDATIEELQRLLKHARVYEQVEAIAKELEDLGRPVDLTRHFGFVTKWVLASGFDNTGGKGYASAYPPERGVDLNAKYAGKKPGITWKNHDTTEKLGVVDLNKFVGKDKNEVAYAYTVVEVPETKEVWLRVACATAVKIFLNGREVLARESYHQGFDSEANVVPVTLKSGRNEILLKVCQNDQKEPWAQNWMFNLRVTDELGAAVPVKVVERIVEAVK